MTGEVPNLGVSESYVQRVMALTQRVYDSTKFSDGISKALEPAVPALQHLQASLYSLVESVRKNPSQILRKENWGPWPSGATIQLAIDSEDPSEITLVTMYYRQSWVHRNPQLTRAMVVRAGSTNFDMARNYFLDDAVSPKSPRWVRFSNHSIASVGIPSFREGLSIEFDDRAVVDDLTYYTHDRGKFRASLGLGDDSIPEDFAKNSDYPWTADLKLGNTPSLKAHKGLQCLLTWVSDQSGQFVDGRNNPHLFDFKNFVESTTSGFPIPV